jgi:hypothetical protein
LERRVCIRLIFQRRKNDYIWIYLRIFCEPFNRNWLNW